MGGSVAAALPLELVGRNCPAAITRIVYLGIDHGYLNIRAQIIAVNAKLLERISPGSVNVCRSPGCPYSDLSYRNNYKS